MVKRYHFRAFLVLLPLFAIAACGDQIPEGWRVLGAEDVERARLMRAISCGETPKVGLIIDEGALSAESKKLINALPVKRQVGDVRIIQPDARTLSSIFLMKGVGVAIDEKTARSLPPLLSPEIINAKEPVAVILDLPVATFTEHLAALTSELSGDAAARLRAMATTGQVSGTLSHESLRRLETLASVCAVYPDATMAPIGRPGVAPQK